MKKPDYQNPTLEEIAIMAKDDPVVAAGMLRQHKRNHKAKPKSETKPSSPESERQKSRSLDKEGKPSEPIPDSSAEASKDAEKI